MSISSIEESARELTRKRDYANGPGRPKSDLDEDQILSDSDDQDLKSVKREEISDRDRLRKQGIGRFVDDEADEDKDDEGSDGDMDIAESLREQYR